MLYPVSAGASFGFGWTDDPILWQSNRMEVGFLGAIGTATGSKHLVGEDKDVFSSIGVCFCDSG